MKTFRLAKIYQYLEKLEERMTHYSEHKLADRRDGDGQLTYAGERAIFEDGQHDARVMIHRDLNQILDEG
jgi:hypothetical protein